MIKSHTSGRIAPAPVGQMPEDPLPFLVALWRARGDGAERVLGRAVNLTLARAIFSAAVQDFPDRRIVLTQGDSIIADSKG